MWQCSQQHENRDEAKFCGKCGEKRETRVSCSACGSKLEPEDVFCTSCGHREAAKTVEPPKAPVQPPHPVEPARTAVPAPAVPAPKEEPAQPPAAPPPPVEAAVEPPPADEPVTFSFGGAKIEMIDAKSPRAPKPAASARGRGMSSMVSAIMGFVLIAAVLGAAFYLITR